MLFRNEVPRISGQRVLLNNVCGNYQAADLPALQPFKSRQERNPLVHTQGRVDVEDGLAIERKRQEYLETDCQRKFRYAQWVGLILAILFIASIVVMLAVLCVRTNDVFNSVDGSTATEKVATILDLAVEGAKNARQATRNVMQVTEFARTTASVAAPQLQRAVNSTNDLVNDLRSWSFHPSLSIAPGVPVVG